jgi:(p)ppGpp synthase/HD superfamily hydrolase
MDKYKLLEKAIRIASNAHFEQKDKAGKPYIFHPFRVRERCAGIDEKIIAMLHDTIEDTEITANRLIAEGFPSYIVDAVQSLTRLESESYEEFIQRVSKNPLSTKVKIADLRDNLDLSRLSRISDSDYTRIDKYIKALDYLNKSVDLFHKSPKKVCIGFCN